MTVHKAHTERALAKYTPRIYKKSNTRDAFRRYVTDAPSPEKFANWLRAVDDGDIAALCELQEGMEAKDAWLQGVANTRRGAITALQWDVEVDEHDSDDNEAKAVAAYVRKHLRSLRAFPQFLIHMQSAIGPNIAVAELVWHRGNLIDIEPIPCHRLTESPFKRGVVAIMTDEFPTGLPTDFVDNKFVVYHPDERGGFPLRKTMTHATVWPYLVNHFSRTDWMAYSELYGTPIKTFTYDDTVIDEDRKTVFEMIEEMDTDTAASLPTGVKLELLQAAGTGETFQRQMDQADGKISVLWLGQTLTTDVGSVGSFAAAKVHDNVRADILLHDLNAEAAMIGTQVIEPIVRLRFPNWRGSIPAFKRLLHERKDIEASRLRADQLRIAIDMNLDLDPDEVYEVLEFTKPAPKAEDEKDTQTREHAATINELTLGIERAVRAGDLGLVNALRKQISTLLDQELPDLTELPTSTKVDKVTDDE